MPLACLVCLVMALPPLDPLVRGGTWWVPAFVMMVAVAGVSALYRLSGRGSLAVPFLQLLVAAFLVTPLFAGHVAPLGLVPNGDVLAHLGMALEQGAQTIDGNAPPVSSSAGVTLIIALCLTVFMMAADFLAVTARCPGMVGVLVLALMAVPLVLHDTGLSWLAAAGCAVGFLLLLAADTGVRSREWGMPAPGGQDSSARAWGAVRRAATVSLALAAAVLLALTVPLALPWLRTDAFHAMADGTYIGTGSDVITTTHPLVSLRRELASSSDRTVLTYRTDAERPDYLRTYVLDEFDGVNWTMTPVNASRDTRVDGELPLPTGWGSVPSQETVSTRIWLDSDAPPVDFLPLPYWARTVQVSGEWYADPGSLMVFTTSSPPTGLGFSVETVDRVPAPEDLADSGEPRSLPGDFRNLPRDLDPRVRELAEALTEDARSPYERAVALQDYFTGGAFTYDLSPPAVPGGSDPLAHFLLEDRVGYCEQFAGAMAVMARQVDIPARVAVGYTAGERMGDGRWAVSAGDAHAWPELYFEGTGWVRFEPTPASSGGQGSASVPEYTRGAQEDGAGSPDGAVEEDPAAGVTEAPERPDGSREADEAESDQAPSESGEPEDEPSASAAAPDGDGRAGSGLAWLPAAAAVAGGLLLSALPALVRALVRWSRTAALASGAAGSAHTAWRELRDTCLDLGGTWTLAESPRATATRLAGSGAAPEAAPGRMGLMSGAVREPVPEEAAAALWRLALAEEAARYAPSPTEPEALRQDLETARAGLAATVRPGARVRAVLLPRSLAPWNRPRPVPDPEPVTS
ncbi:MULTISPECIES: transglutaminaseTgpA domain-containing protein [unclassified Nocardiopsis]|uniref:transglutaminaseTgpA domain-containing protein n=1 Tax=unclassified Nocardiopsis TaxID=2649073 RepID=UPI001357C9A4|nr:MULTISPECIES: transglutaminaseTgpA domain-containing protein [unclassified Nocardiopsis]